MRDYIFVSTTPSSPAIESHVKVREAHIIAIVTIVIIVTHNHPTTIPQPLYNHPTTIPQPSHNHPTTITQPSHNHYTTTSQPSHHHPTTIPQPSHNHPTTIPPPSHNHPTTIPPPSHNHYTTIPVFMTQCETTPSNSHTIVNITTNVCTYFLEPPPRARGLCTSINSH